jgi:alpha-1,6-mannosyltransferase
MAGPGRATALRIRPPSPALPLLLLLWAAVAGLALLGPDRARLVPALGAYTVAFLALLTLWRSHGKVLDDPRILLGGAVLLRLTLLPALPDLSDDLYRYIWDGWLLVSGVSPYGFVPLDPALGRFQEDLLFRRLNSPGLFSIYPPVSQLVFAPAGLVHELVGWPASAHAVKGGFLALEISGILLMLRAVRALGVLPRHLSLYAWNPLVVVTVAGSGHTEGGLALGMGLLALGVASSMPRTAWVGLVLATLSKGVPLVLAPLLLRLHLGRMDPRAALLAALPALGVGLVLTAPFLLAGMIPAAARSAELYVRLFEFNAGPYLLVKEIAARLTGEDWSKVLGPGFLGVFLAAALLVWFRWPVATARDWFRGSLVLLGLYLVTATTVHPWYLNWGLLLVPFTTLTRGAWLWASWAAFLTYFTYVGVPHGPLTALVWVGAGAFLALEASSSLRDRLLPVAGLRKARQILPHVRGRRVLDLGAGEGYVGRRLTDGAEGPRTVVLADVTRAFRVDLPAVVCAGERMPFPDRSMDTVVLSLVLHHTANPDGVISEALRLARSRVIITESVFRWGWERSLLERVDRWANRARGGGAMDRDPHPLRFRTAGQWEGAVRAAGGRVLTSRRLNLVGHRHHLLVVAPP